MMFCCTYFDARYLTRALALYRSLERRGEPFRLWMLCLDEESLTMLTTIALPHAVVMSNEELQAHFPQLRVAQGNRSVFEYYATVKAFQIRMIFERHPEVDSLFFLDADFCFFGDPQVLPRELSTHAVLLSPHRLTPKPVGSKALAHGTYNAGFIAFRRSGGREPLRWWCDRVLEWCGDRSQDGLFADQGYLDRMIEEFPGVHACTHHGINVAPWNLDERRVTITDSTLHAGSDPLIFVHFHGLRRLAWRIYDTGTAPYRMQPSSVETRRIFLPYIRELRDIGRWLAEQYGYAAQEGSVRHPSASVLHSPLLLLSRLRRRQWMIA